MTLRGLATLGSVDLLYVGEVDRWADKVPADGPVSEAREELIPRRRPGVLARARWMLTAQQPLQTIEWSDRRPSAPIGDRYDVAWYFRGLAYALVAESVNAEKHVVDLNDLEDRKIRLAHESGAAPRSIRRRLAGSRNATAWTRYQRRVASQVDAVTVCSEEDRQQLGVPNGSVVPNCFPEVPLVERSDSPGVELLLVGTFDYAPNADAAEFFVREVLPEVRRGLPAATVRMVGATSARVRNLSAPGVTVVGEVENLTDEYRRATLAVVPVRFGGGTRIKILEAFARGVPVVSTSVGAAGLQVSAGRDLLLADDARTFAEAVVAAAADAALRRQLAGAGRALYEKRYSQASMTRSIVDALRTAGALRSG